MWIMTSQNCNFEKSSFSLPLHYYTSSELWGVYTLTSFISLFSNSYIIHFFLSICSTEYQSFGRRTNMRKGKTMEKRIRRINSWQEEGWLDGSVDMNKNCSFMEPRFSSYHPYLVAHNCQLQEIWYTLLAIVGTTLMCTRIEVYIIV